MPNLPAVIRILLVFMVALLAIRRKCPIGIALFVGAVLMGFLFGCSPEKVARSLVTRASSLGTLYILSLVWLILSLSRAMDKAGQLDRIVRTFISVLGGTKMALMALPALIGLLPMPGGAVFSAPMVESALKGNPTSPRTKTTINYWFRHVWEYWWPMYPGVILAMELTKLPPWKFMLFQFPLTPVAIVSGYFFIIRPLQHQSAKDPRKDEGKGAAQPFKESGKRDLLREILPIVLVIVTLIPLSLVKSLDWVSADSEFWNKAPLVMALLVGLLWVFASNRMSISSIRSSIFSRAIGEMFILVIGIMVFSGMLDDSGAVLRLTTEMKEWGVPLVGVATFVPFLCGLITGLAAGFVGSSFPLVVAIVRNSGLADQMPAYALLAYAFGYIGMMLSPVHLCLVLTRQYWDAPLQPVYRKMAGPCVCILVAAVALFLLYSRWL
jgi:hypothetical protein